jgi:hypothetical protein
LARDISSPVSQRRVEQAPGEDAGGFAKSARERRNIKTVMGKLKPFITTFIVTLACLAIISRISALRKIAYNEP